MTANNMFFEVHFLVKQLFLEPLSTVPLETSGHTQRALGKPPDKQESLKLYSPSEEKIVPVWLLLALPV